MSSIKNLSKKQLRDLRSQVRASRQKEIEDLSKEDPDLAEEKIKEMNTRKDRLGFSRKDRQDISEKISSLDKTLPKVTWNFEVGSLVVLPSGDIGIIVRNEAQDLEMKYYEYDMKKSMKINRYAGQVYVVTSNGNNWYYPSQLKNVKQ